MTRADYGKTIAMTEDGNKEQMIKSPETSQHTGQPGDGVFRWGKGPELHNEKLGAQNWKLDTIFQYLEKINFDLSQPKNGRSVFSELVKTKQGYKHLWEESLRVSQEVDQKFSQIQQGINTAHQIIEEIEQDPAVPQQKIHEVEDLLFQVEDKLQYLRNTSFIKLAQLRNVSSLAFTKAPLSIEEIEPSASNYSAKTEGAGSSIYEEFQSSVNSLFRGVRYTTKFAGGVAAGTTLATLALGSEVVKADAQPAYPTDEGESQDYESAQFSDLEKVFEQLVTNINNVANVASETENQLKLLSDTQTENISDAEQQPEPTPVEVMIADSNSPAETNPQQGILGELHIGGTSNIRTEPSVESSVVTQVNGGTFQILRVIENAGLVNNNGMASTTWYEVADQNGTRLGYASELVGTAELRPVPEIPVPAEWQNVRVVIQSMDGQTQDTNLTIQDVVSRNQLSWERIQEALNTFKTRMPEALLDPGQGRHQLVMTESASEDEILSSNEFVVIVLTQAVTISEIRDGQPVPITHQPGDIFLDFNVSIPVAGGPDESRPARMYIPAGQLITEINNRMTGLVIEGFESGNRIIVDEVNRAIRVLGPNNNTVAALSLDAFARNDGQFTNDALVVFPDNTQRVSIQWDAQGKPISVATPEAPLTIEIDQVTGVVLAKVSAEQIGGQVPGQEVVLAPMEIASNSEAFLASLPPEIRTIYEGAEFYYAPQMDSGNGRYRAYFSRGYLTNIGHITTLSVPENAVNQAYESVIAGAFTRLNGNRQQMGLEPRDPNLPVTLEPVDSRPLGEGDNQQIVGRIDRITEFVVTRDEMEQIRQQFRLDPASLPEHIPFYLDNRSDVGFAFFDNSGVLTIVNTTYREQATTESNFIGDSAGSMFNFLNNALAHGESGGFVGTISSSELYPHFGCDANGSCSTVTLTP